MMVMVLTLTILPCLIGLSNLLGPEDVSTARLRSWSTWVCNSFFMLLPLLAILMVRRSLCCAYAFLIASVYCGAWSIFWWQWETDIWGSAVASSMLFRMTTPFCLICGVLSIYFIATSREPLRVLRASRRWWFSSAIFICALCGTILIIWLLHQRFYKAEKEGHRVAQWAIKMAMRRAGPNGNPQKYIKYYLGEFARKQTMFIRMVNEECAKRAAPGENPNKYFDEVWKEMVSTTMSSSTTSEPAPNAASEAAQD